MHYDLFCSVRKQVDSNLLRNFYLVKEIEPDSISFVYPTPDKAIKVIMRKLSKVDLEKEAGANRRLLNGVSAKGLYDKDIACSERTVAKDFLQVINQAFFNNAVVNLPAHDIMYAVVSVIEPLPLGHVIVSISGTSCLSISSSELFIDKVII